MEKVANTTKKYLTIQLSHKVRTSILYKSDNQNGKIF